MFHSSQPLPATLPAFLKAYPAAHELRAPAGTAAHAGLAVRLLSEIWQQRPALWVSTAPDWYPPGLAWAGLDVTCCLFARARDDAEALGSAEIALRGGMAAAVECEALPRLAAKRLALAARRGNALGLVLRHAPAQTAQDSTAFASRWMVSPASGNRLRAELLYAKGALPGVYMLPLKEEQENAQPPLALPRLRRAG